MHQQELLLPYFEYETCCNKGSMGIGVETMPTFVVPFCMEMLCVGVPFLFFAYIASFFVGRALYTKVTQTILRYKKYTYLLY